jgi:hypothetical protein
MQRKHNLLPIFNNAKNIFIKNLYFAMQICKKNIPLQPEIKKRRCVVQ